MHPLFENMSFPTNEVVDDLLGIADDDPRTYKQATEAYDAAQWDDGYNDEM
jgi:hypothetical protein